jgi:hypothetical protein
MLRANFFGRTDRIVMLLHTPPSNSDGIGANQQDAFGPGECGNNAAPVVKVGKTQINAAMSEVSLLVWCACRCDYRTILLFKQNLNDATADLAGCAAY